jgi:hypothetical protein
MKRRKVAKRALYASLYGVANSRSIDTQLLLDYAKSVTGKAGDFAERNLKGIARLGSLGKKGVGAVLKKYTGIDIHDLDLKWGIGEKNTVICFDDLERCEMPMKEILGYINHFVEHCGSNVIVICNEDEVGSDHDQARQSEYQKMKEKVVGSSIAFKPNHQEVLGYLWEQYKQRNRPFYE